MARHRNVRGMDYDEEYDEYYEEMASSLDESEYGVSPTTAKQYIYNHTDPEMGQRIRTLSISEECEDGRSPVEQSQEFTRLDARTYECMEKIQDLVGNSFEDEDVIRAIKLSNYDSEKAIDMLLNPNSHKILTELPTTSTKETLPPKEAAIPKESVSKKPLPKVLTTTAATVSQKQQQPKVVGKNVTPPTERKGLVPSASVGSNLDATPQASPLSTPKALKAITRKSSEEIQAMYAEACSGKKPKINLVIVGHVDAGKSTIMGHLLYLKGSVSQKVIYRNEVDSRKIGKSSFMYAWVLDQTEEERSRGVTIDVGQYNFETEKRSVTILDAPGHRDFIPNMIVGATKADVAILVVDATKGEFETGFESGGQTQEHTLLLRSLGISQLAVVVNKIDNAEFSQERFDSIVLKLSKFLKSVGFKETDLHFIPCSGLTGDNLVQSSTNPAFEWFKGQTLIQVIDDFVPNERPVTRPFRMSVKDVFKGVTAGICVAGKIDSGYVETNHKIYVKPLNEVATVRNIYNDEQPMQNGFAGDVLTLNLTTTDSFVIQVGHVLTDLWTVQNTVTKFEAQVFIYSNVTRAVMLGFPVMLYSVCVSEVAKISKFVTFLDKKNEPTNKVPRVLTKNDRAIVEFTVTRPVFLELYSEFKEYGRIVFRSGDTTVGAGIITKLLA